MSRRNKRRRHRSAAIVVLVVLAAAAAGVLLWRSIRLDSRAEGVERIGDEGSDDYDWEGRYYDSGTMTALSIERTGSSYSVSVSNEGEDGTIRLWSFTCTYAASSGIMPYEDAVRTNVAVTMDGDASSDAVSFDRRTVYEGGSGYLYLKDHVIHWVDEEESFGNGMMFEKL